MTSTTPRIVRLNDSRVSDFEAIGDCCSPSDSSFSGSFLASRACGTSGPPNTRQVGGPTTRDNRLCSRAGTTRSEVVLGLRLGLPASSSNPSTLLSLHRALTQRKYWQLFSCNMPRKPEPKRPTPEIVAAVVDMKRRKPTWGCLSGSLNRSPWPSAFRSTRTSCGASSPFGTGRHPTRLGPRGSPSSVHRLAFA